MVEDRVVTYRRVDGSFQTQTPEDQTHPVARMQKLQIHVVAQAGGSEGRLLRYKQLATVLHDFLSGVRAVETCLRLLEVYSNPTNREPLRLELRLAGVTPAARTMHKSTSQRKGKEAMQQAPSDSTTRNQGWDGENVENVNPNGEELRQQFLRPPPFPFILTCLLVGSSLNPDAGELWQPTEQPHGMPFDGTVNEGVYLLLDVTEPERCRYAFLQVPWRGDQVPMSEPTNQPLSANEFLLAGLHPELRGQFMDHYPKAEQLLPQLETFEIIGVGCMVDLWPWWPDWQARIDEHGQEQPASVALMVDSGFANIHLTNKKQSLKSMAFDRAIDSFLASPNPDITLFDQVRKMPDFQEYLLICLELRAGLVVANMQAGIKLLKLAFHEARHIDLGPYEGLPLDGVMTILQSSGISESFSSLSIPTGTLVSPEDVLRLASALPATGIAGLYIPQLPNFDGDTSFASAAFYAFRPKVHEKLFLGSAFSHGVHGRPWLDGNPSNNFSAETTLRVSPEYSGKEHSNTESARAPGSTIGLPNVLYTIRNADNQTPFNITQLIVNVGAHSERHLDSECFETHYLEDALLTPSRFITGLISLLCLRIISVLPTENGSDTAFCFAAAPSSLHPESQAEIGPLSAETYALGSRSTRHLKLGNRSVWARLRNLTLGAWTAVMVQEQSQRALRRGEHSDDTEDDEFLDDILVRGKAKFFRVAMVRPRAGSTIRLSSEEAITTDVIETLSLKDFLRHTTGSTEGFDEVVGDFTRLAHGMWKASISDRYGRLPEALMRRPVLSELLSEDVCQILNDAVKVEQEVTEAEKKCQLPPCGHRACSCQGRRYMGR